VARKKRKKHSWRRTLLIFVVMPLTVWFLAFLIWFFWYDMNRFLGPGKTVTRPKVSSSPQGERATDRESRPATGVPENIPDEDRRKLDDILQQRK
jgi:hypothetical protein